MTQRGNAIMSQVIISVFVSAWLLVSFFMVDVMCICDVFDDFRRNNYQGIIDAGEFFLWCSHYLIIGGLIGFFGIYMRNMVTNILGVLWSLSFLFIRIGSFALFQAYFFTTWEGRLYLVDISARVLVLLIAVVGIVMTCRRWYKYYQTKKLDK